tara:strand:- start:1429 stop:2103 length:675 start_codon:yes stop_codon:yes gene_type:complete
MDINKLFKNFIKDEQNVGKLTSIVSVIVANVLNIFLNVGLGLNIQQSTGLSIYVVGNLVGYVLDLLFAKRKLYMKDENGKPKLIKNFNDRVIFLLFSFYSKYFFKFLILCIIDTAIGLILLKYAILMLDKHKILVDFKYRNLLLALIIPAITFGLYVNQLRFNWAYEFKENLVLSIIMYMWLTIILLFTININHDVMENYENFESINKRFNNFIKKIKDEINIF